MKKFLAVLCFAAFLTVGAHPARADGCYLCAGGGYVRYRGSDTFAKRKEAKRKCGCKVTGTTSSCSNPKCTVSVLGWDIAPLIRSLGRRLGLSIDVCRLTR